MTSSIKILHVAETAKGGVGTYIDEVAVLQLAGHGEGNVRVVLPDAHAAQLQRVPVAVQRPFSARGGRIVNTLRMVGVAWRQVREWKPDVVHLHSMFAGFALRPLLMLQPSRPRVVYCAHSWAFDREGPAMARRAIQRVERIWSAWCDSVVCVSRHDFSGGLHIGIPRDRLVLVDNGVRDLDTPAHGNAALGAWPQGVRRVLFVGRLDRQKGVDLLFDAMRRLEGKAFAVIVGASVVGDDGPAGAPANVRITGWLPRDEINAYYAAAEVVIIPSRWEGLPLVAVEAMRAGRAIVAAAAGGLKDVVVDGETGRLVGLEDAAALARAVDELSAEQVQAMGRAGRERYVRLYRIERVVEDLDAVYRAVLARRGSKGSAKVAVPSSGA